MPSLSSIELKSKQPSRKNKHNHTLTSFVNSEKESKKTNAQTQSLSKRAVIRDACIPVQKDQRKSIIHNFKAIPHDTVLYSQKRRTATEPQSGSVPFDRLYVGANSSVRIGDSLVKWSLPKRAISPLKATSISVSGLAAYDFTSVKARSNLIHETSEAAYLKNVQEIRRRLDIDKLRAEDISKRSSKQRHSMRQECSEAILMDCPSLPTEDYLNVLQSGKFSRSLIFGQTAENYRVMQRYVAEEKEGRDIAEFIMQEIKLSKPQVVALPRRGKAENINSLQGRREPVRVRRVLCSVNKEESG